MALISVIMPVYNVEKYLENSLNSVLTQSFTDIEVICVNDESTDGSLEILKEFEQKDRRVKVINQKNRGNGGARNTGLKHAKGEYIYFFDSDDALFPEALEKMYENITSNESDLVLFKVARYVEGEPLNYNRPIFPLDKKFKGKDFDDFTFTYKDIKYYIMDSGYFAVWAKFYKKEFLDEHGDILVFPENTAFGDVRFHIASMILASRISFVNDFLYRYTLSNKNSITQNKSNRMDIFGVVDSVEEFFMKTGYFEEFKDDFIKFKIHQLLFYMFSANSDEYFNRVYEEFSKIKIEDYNVPTVYKGKYELVLDSKNYKNFLRIITSFDNKKNEKYNIITKTKETEKLKKENKKLKNQIKEYKFRKIVRLIDKIKHCTCAKCPKSYILKKIF